MTQTVQREWQAREFVKTLSDAKLPRRGKLQARDYRPAGKFPVVDQGQKYVAGWTDDVSLVIESGLPYIVFGDHTRAFKYVDHPFVLGADGTQLLKPTAEFNPRFFYYACLQLDLPSRGYNRHFTFLKEKTLPLPPKQEQEKIAAVLWKLQRAIATQDRLMAATRDLKHSAMHRLFTLGLRGEPIKETEIGPMPASWIVGRFDSLAVLQRGFDLPVAQRKEGTIPVIGSTGVIGYHHEARVRAPGVVTGRSGSIGSSSYLTVDFWPLNTSLYVRNFNGNEPQYVHYFIQWFDLSRFKGGVSVPTLNRNMVHDSLVPIPDPTEQRDIAVALSTIDSKLAHHQKKRVALNDLFQTLLHKLMTGEIRVADVDIDTSQITAPPGAPT